MITKEFQNKRNIVTFMIGFFILLSFIFLDWSTTLPHDGGVNNLSKILHGALHPSGDLDQVILATITTIAYAAFGILLAIIIGLIFAIFASGLFFKNKILQKIAINILAFTRSIHELIWAFFFVAAIGLNPWTALLAISIPYGGMLGKVYTNLFLTTDHPTIAHLQSLGLKKTQSFLFAYLPLAFKHMMSYTIYRFECAIRSSSVLSFVGLGGIGLKIHLALNDLKYDQAFLYIYVLILIVFIVEIWGNLHRKNQVEDKVSWKLLIILMTASVFFVGIVEEAFYTPLFTSKNATYTLDFIRKLFDLSNPAFFNIIEIKSVLKLTLETLQMSLIAISLASIAMMLTLVLATRQYSRKFIYVIVRTSYLISRAIPELIWAMIIVFIIKPGLWAGALALALHNYGILSKLCAEVIEDINQHPLAQLTSNGLKKSQLLIFGVLPLSGKKIIHYIIYRWEIILRTTMVVGFIGAGGLGYYFKIHMSFFHYTNITLVMIAYLLLVKISDWVSHTLTKVY